VETELNVGDLWNKKQARAVDMSAIKSRFFTFQAILLGYCKNFASRVRLGACLRFPLGPVSKTNQKRQHVKEQSRNSQSRQPQNPQSLFPFTKNEKYSLAAHRNYSHFKGNPIPMCVCMLLLPSRGLSLLMID